MARTIPPPPLTWRVTARPGGAGTLVVFHGELNEDVDLSGLSDGLRGAVEFDLGSVQRVNSGGVREWIRFVRDLPAVTELVFSRCSPPVVLTLSMIANFRGPATVRSFFASYCCLDCDRDEHHLVDVAADCPDGRLDRMPAFPCSECGEPMELNDLPDRFVLLGS
jgi:hypothetical protein